MRDRVMTDYIGKRLSIQNEEMLNLFFAYMLSDAVQDAEEGVYIRYHLNGSILDLMV